MALTRVLLTLGLLAAAISSVSACSVTGIDVTKASIAAKPSDSNAYALVDVKEHFDNMQPIKFVSNTDQTYTCVDARGDDSHLSTPG